MVDNFIAPFSCGFMDLQVCNEALMKEKRLPMYLKTKGEGEGRGGEGACLPVLRQGGEPPGWGPCSYTNASDNSTKITKLICNNHETMIAGNSNNCNKENNNY